MDQMRLQFNGHEQKLQFKFVGNNFDDSHLPFMNGDEQYFQAQYCYRSNSFRPIPFYPIYFLSNGNLAHACC